MNMIEYKITVLPDDKDKLISACSHIEDYEFSVNAKSPEEARDKGILLFKTAYPDENIDDYISHVSWP